MRLWHQSLIPKLPRQQLLGQHRECCALRGLGWDKKHSTIDYIFKYTRFELFRYHYYVMHEMNMRGYKVSPEWKNAFYRGKKLSPDSTKVYLFCTDDLVYQEHNDEYLKECIDNLRTKGIEIE